MAKDSDNLHAFGDLENGIFYAPLGTEAPTDPTTDLPEAWTELGWIDDGGVTESDSVQETKKYGWQGASLIRVLRSQLEHSLQFNALEENAAVYGLRYPGASTETGTGTAEVQTVTMTGTGTAGTFSLTIPGYGTASDLAYNVTTTSLATTLTTLVGDTVAVSGTAGSSYVITFPVSAGNVALASAANSITGVTAIGVVETTPGVGAVNTITVKPNSSQNFKSFVLQRNDGDVHYRIYIAKGEVTGSGDVVYKADDLTVYAFTLNCYVDDDGNWFKNLNDNPALAL